MSESSALMEAKDAAGWLGISRALLARLRREGKIKYVRMGGTVRFRLKDLEKFTDESLCTGPTKPPPRPKVTTA
jgi:excisionase family DNA binding protein